MRTPKSLLVAVALAVVALALASQFAVPLPFSDVPLTLQSLAVLLVGAALPPMRAALAVIVWLALAALGAPLLAGGASGLGGPTTGYLLAMPAAAAMVSARPTLLTMLAAHALILAAGGLWLASIIGAAKALSAGVWPFLPGALIKSLIAAVAAPRLVPRLPPRA
jgi:biotin transport system substrate-specific component